MSLIVWLQNFWLRLCPAAYFAVLSAVSRKQGGRKMLPTRAGSAMLKLVWLTGSLGICGTLVWFVASRNHDDASLAMRVHTYPVRGTIQELKPQEKSIVVSHQAIPSYMDAMTMPFRVRSWEELKGLQAGDQISFRLSVTETESWIGNIVKLAAGGTMTPVTAKEASANLTPGQGHHPLLDYPFTNELGQAICLHSFEGQALAVTFFFTRCPLPDFCPRLSKNFAEASRQLNSLSQAPTNWHFLSVTFDPDFDNPQVLKAYAKKYEYNPNHWSFITGPKDKIGELARLSNVQFEPDGGLFNHNFRTMIIDASGRLQMVFPTGGDLSEAIVSELLKAAVAGKNKPS
jgi:protein SCO1/2